MCKLVAGTLIPTRFSQEVSKASKSMSASIGGVYLPDQKQNFPCGLFLFSLIWK
jgi:hypothetical protein